MSDINDDYVSPDDVSLPDASYEVVQETYQPPTASIESIKASEQPQASVGYVQLNGSDPSHEQTQKGV